MTEAACIQPISFRLAEDSAMHADLAEMIAGNRAAVMGGTVAPGSVHFAIAEPVRGLDGEPLAFSLPDGTTAPALPAIRVTFDLITGHP